MKTSDKEGKKVHIGEVITYTITVKNTGKVAGSETVQMYLTDKEASVERPEKELKGFKKVFLQPGETKEVTLLIDQDDLSFYHPEKKTWMSEKGAFEVKVGNASDRILLTSAFDF